MVTSADGLTIGRTALLEVNLVISQGSDNAYAFRYSRKVGGTVTAVNLTGWVGRSQIRNRVGGEVLLTLNPTLNADGTIEVFIAGAETTGAAWDARSFGVWDMELVDPDGAIVRFVEGSVWIGPDVTR